MQGSSTLQFECLELRLLFSGAVVTTYGRSISYDLPTIAYDADRELLYIADGNRPLLRYDILNEKFLEPFTPTGFLAGLDISLDEQTLFAADFNQQNGLGTLHRINLTDGSDTPLTYPVGANEQLSSFGANLDVAAMSDGTLLQWSRDNWPYYNPLRQFEVSTGNVTELTSPLGFDHFRRATDGKTFFVKSRQYNDADGPHLKPYVDVQPSLTSPDGLLSTRDNLVLNRDDATVYTIPTSGRALAFDPTRHVLYTSDPRSNDISVIDTRTWQTLSVFHTGSFAKDAVVTNDGSRLFAVEDNQIELFTLSPRPTASINVTGPVNIGQTVDVHVDALDASAAMAAWSGTLHFSSDDPTAVLPPDTSVSFTAGEGASFEASLSTPGSHLITVSDATNGLFSNVAVRVDAGPPTVSLSGYHLPHRDYEPLLVDVQWQDDIQLVPLTDADRRSALVAVAPNGTTYPLEWPCYETDPVHGDDSSGARMIESKGPYFGLLPPDGHWSPQDRGTYVIRALPGATRDELGNASAGGDVGVVGFSWNLGYDLDCYLDAVKPAALKAGSAIATTLSIGNVGDYPASGTSRVTVSVVPDTETDDGTEARVLRVWDQRLDLDYEEHREFKLRLKLPIDLSEGSYHLVTVVSPLAGQEAYENSGGYPSRNFDDTPTFEVFAGHLVAASGVASEALSPGQPVATTVTVVNDGHAAAAGRYLLMLLATPDSPEMPDGGGSARELLTTTRSIHLKSGSQRVMNFRFVVPADFAAGDYRLQVQLTPA